MILFEFVKIKFFDRNFYTFIYGFRVFIEISDFISLLECKIDVRHKLGILWVENSDMFVSDPFR